MFGEAGRDRLTGGNGRNRCWGGAGADVFVLSAGGRTKVMDWQKGKDLIVVDGVASFGIVRNGSDALVVSGAGDRLAIIKHAAGQLDVSERDAFTII